jgi:lipopolysaccharide/colanic/teichoic acid biosynthesis glycosyltransferase
MYFFLKRIFDIVASLIVLSVLFPFLLIVGLVIVIDSPGGPFYIQTRVGKNAKEFGLIKFRSMRPNADKSGQLTVGNDARVTKVGKFIRRFKIDEFPQLLNIIIGDMSIVGPRPEVPKYVALYSEEQRTVLTVLPGLTDFATIEYIDEQEILGKAEDPEKAYIEKVMPDKLSLNLKYIDQANFWLDISLIIKTIGKIFS